MFDANGGVRINDGTPIPIPGRNSKCYSSHDVDGELETLMARYCDGDAAAFHAIYGKAAPRMLGYLQSLVGERATAEDLLQLTFIKIHEARDIYVRGADPLPWFYTIAHRTALDELRRRKRRPRVAKDLDNLPERPATLDGTAEDAVADEPFDPALGAAALAALEELPLLQREAVLLTKIHGRSVAEAAVICGTTPGAIKVRAHRGYEVLRKLLGRREAS